MKEPRRAFRRRVLYGMETMDSAELVALCLELGHRLDARSRSAALATLDPRDDGVITEASHQRTLLLTMFPRPRTLTSPETEDSHLKSTLFYTLNRIPTHFLCHIQRYTLTRLPCHHC